MNPPYYAVIFSSTRANDGNAEYDKMAIRMDELAKEQPGYLGIESTRGSDGFGITVSYWQSEKDIAAWKAHSEHKIAQEFGRSRWYDSFSIRICKVEREYGFDRATSSGPKF